MGGVRPASGSYLTHRRAEAAQLTDWLNTNPEHVEEARRPLSGVTSCVGAPGSAVSRRCAAGRPAEER